MNRTLLAFFGTVLGGPALLLLLEACGVPGFPAFEHVPLVGGHAVIGCADCHTTGSLTDPLPGGCAGCHEDDRPDPHYPGDCVDCHSPSGWDDVIIDHTPFLSLEGGHDPLACTDCHDPDDFTTLDNACESCHEPDRPTGHFDGACASCHDVYDWEDGQFDHTRYLSLQGGHAPLACTDCHAVDTYEGLDDACESCHLPDRPANHFQGTCASCHNVFDWDDADFDHDQFFPTPHRGVSDCESCHPAAPNYDTFTCTDCHAHRQSEMDDEHRGEVSGYSYNSQACLNCHPRGREEDD